MHLSSVSKRKGEDEQDGGSESHGLAIREIFARLGLKGSPVPEIFASAEEGHPLTFLPYMQDTVRAAKLSFVGIVLILCYDGGYAVLDASDSLWQYGCYRYVNSQSVVMEVRCNAKQTFTVSLCSRALECIRKLFGRAGRLSAQSASARFQILSRR